MAELKLRTSATRPLAPLSDTGTMEVLTPLVLVRVFSLLAKSLQLQDIRKTLESLVLQVAKVCERYLDYVERLPWAQFIIAGPLAALEEVRTCITRSTGMV